MKSGWWTKTVKKRLLEISSRKLAKYDPAIARTVLALWAEVRANPGKGTRLDDKRWSRSAYANRFKEFFRDYPAFRNTYFVEGPIQDRFGHVAFVVYTLADAEDGTLGPGWLDFNALVRPGGDFLYHT